VAQRRAHDRGTEINSAIIQVPPPELLDEWAARYSIADFGAAAFEPYLQRARRELSAQPTQGPLGPPSDRLRQGAYALGWRVTPLDRAVRACVGTNHCALGCPMGAKQSMTATRLPRSLGRGLRLVAERRVERLLRRGRRVVGAVACAGGQDGRTHRLTINAEAIFLAAGAVQTPALLRRSRRNTLRLHPTMRAIAVFDEAIDAHLWRLPLNAVTEFMPGQRLGGSIFLPGFFGMALAEDRERRAPLLRSWRHCALYYAMARGRGVGTVRTLPLVDEPIVRYRLAPEDGAGLVAGLARLAEALFAAGARRVIPAIKGHAGWSDPAQARRFATAALPRDRASLMSAHLFSSCVPGADPRTSVTDSFGRLHACENLFLADASQIPEAPGVNPQAAVMALACRAAEAFLASSAAARRRAAFQGEVAA
jgi:choline dehydrogenase-like flavoprotein